MPEQSCRARPAWPVLALRLGGPVATPDRTCHRLSLVTNGEGTAERGAHGARRTTGGGTDPPNSDAGEGATGAKPVPAVRVPSFLSRLILFLNAPAGTEASGPTAGRKRGHPHVTCCVCAGSACLPQAVLQDNAPRCAHPPGEQPPPFRVSFGRKRHQLCRCQVVRGRSLRPRQTCSLHGHGLPALGRDEPAMRERKPRRVSPTSGRSGPARYHSSFVVFRRRVVVAAATISAFCALASVSAAAKAASVSNSF